MKDDCQGCDDTDCQDCCCHDDTDHGICLDCGKDCLDELIDAAESAYEGER